MAHSMFSPSKSHRWLHCPGSVALCFHEEDNAGEAADEGTAAHELASRALSQGLPAETWLGEVIEVLNEDGTVRRSFTVSESMVEHVQGYVERTLKTAADAGEGVVEVETRVELDSVLGTDSGEKGTADAIALGSKYWVVTDLKFGAGVEVRVLDEFGELNPQLGLYALGVLDMWEPVLGLPEDGVLLVVDQPRYRSMGNWSAHRASLQELGALKRSAQAAVDEAFEGFDECAEPRSAAELHAAGLLRPKGSACQWCSAKGTCPALREQARAQVFEDLADGAPVPVETATVSRDKLPSPEELAVVEQYIKGVRERIFAELSVGHAVDGWKLAKGRDGARKWTDEGAVEAQLKKWRVTRKLGYNEKLKSPTQLEKAMKDDAKHWAALQELITREEGRETVVPAYDPRPEIKEDLLSEFEAAPEPGEGLL